MRKSILYIASCFLLLLSSSAAWATTPDALFKELAANDPAKTAEVVEKMVASGKKEFYPVLNGIMESSIYVLSGKAENAGLVIAMSTGEGQEGENLYELLEIYPEPSEIKDPLGNRTYVKASELQEITVSRKVRLSIQKGIPDIQLYHWDTKKRKLALKTIAATGTLKDVKKLQAVLDKETDPKVRREGREAILQLMLLGSDEKSVRIQAVQGLEENKGKDVLNILTQALENEKDEEVKAEMETAIASIESRNNKIEIGQNLFTGLSLGSILILMALGLAIIYGLMGIINMAHGEFMMIGAYTTFVVQGLFAVYLPAAFDYYFWLALPASFLIAGLIGIVVEFLVIRHLYNKPLESLLATWGVSLVLIQLARTIFGDLTAVKSPSFASGGFEIVPQLTLPFNRLFIIGVSLLVIVIVQLILSRTSFGLKIRAVTQNAGMSACLGVPTKKVNRYAFFMGTGIAGVAGWAITLVGNVVPDMGQTYIVDSFLVVVTGGVGKLVGTVFSGLGMGFFTKMFEPVFQAVYGKVLILVLIILFLQIKPTGLFPAKGRSEED